MFMAGLMAQRLLAASGITFIGSESAMGLTTGNYTCDIPAAAQTGDLIIVLTMCSLLTDTNMLVNTSGYTEQGDLYVMSNDSGFGTNMGVYTKVIGGTVDTTVSVRGRTIQAQNKTLALVFRGVDTTTPLDVAMTTSSRNGFASILAPTITPVTAGAVVVSLGAASSFYVTGTGNQNTPPTAPDDYTLADGNCSGFDSRVSNIAAAYIPWSGSGAVGGDNFGGAYNFGSSRCSLGASLALRPA